MNHTLYPWQVPAWQQLARLREFLPHAILFHGPEGIGKTAFVERFAQSLLCETPATDGQACAQCISCGWFTQYSHPDYRRVRPEVLDENADAEDEDTAEPADVKKSSAKSAKAPSKEIKIDQIRALADFMNISTHRRGKRVIVLYPAEALNTIAANSLLKTLEEPGPDTVFLLVSSGIDRLLPTILSRCRKFALTIPSRDEALHWLEAQNIDDAEAWLCEQGGAVEANGLRLRVKPTSKRVIDPMKAWPVLQNQGNPAQTAGRRLSAHAAIDHAVGIAGLVDFSLQRGGIGLIRGHTRSGRQTVPERDDYRPLIG